MSRSRIVRMEKVRDLRQKELDAKALLLSRARQAEEAARRELGLAEAREQDARRRREDLARGQASMDEWALVEMWLQGAQGAIRRAQDVQGEAARRVAGAERDVLLARTHVERIELLLERYRADIVKLAGVAERKLEDELAGRRPSSY